MADGTERMGQRKCGQTVMRVRKVRKWMNTHDVLMRIHIYFKAILFAFPQYADSIVHEIIVIDPTRMPSVRR
jgi:hypothetical protein